MVGTPVAVSAPQNTPLSLSAEGALAALGDGNAITESPRPAFNPDGQTLSIAAGRGATNPELATDGVASLR